MKEMGYDDALPPDQETVWDDIFSDFKGLESISLPRSVKPCDAVGTPELHTFCDASGKAYGAVAYILWETPNGIYVRLLSAKARVAPLKQTTIPRLELMAALVGSRLARTVKSELRDELTVYLWSDSQIVLHWLKSDSLNLKQFVGVRVAEIQSTCESNAWRYVPTSQNPADNLSRGLTPDEMNGRWMTGPVFLQNGKDSWPAQPAFAAPKYDEGTKMSYSINAVHVAKKEPPIDCKRFSSWSRLVRVTAICYRFIHNLKSKVRKHDIATGPADPEELAKAEQYWIEEAQRDIVDGKRTVQTWHHFLMAV
ncbi:uncharacterized protein LOC135484801 [Lineus longissimus]|uniref:uncharacterized protein LOC135484801 n=1 Tax=Lineus longissimus TaxID=88925 RepID=UPI00315DE9A1